MGASAHAATTSRGLVAELRAARLLCGKHLKKRRSPLRPSDQTY